MDVYLKYHEGDKSSYYYLGMIFNATDQLYNRDLNSGVNDFYKNIKIGGVIKTYIPLFKSPYPFFKEFSKRAVLRWQRNRTGRPLSSPQIHQKNV